MHMMSACAMLNWSKVVWSGLVHNTGSKAEVMKILEVYNGENRKWTPIEARWPFGSGQTGLS